MMKKPDQAKDKPQPARSCDLEFKARCPELFALMTERFWDDGTPRQTATLFAYIDDNGHWKIMVKDRATDQIAFLSAGKLLSGLEVFEGQLKSNSVDWRPDRPPGSRGRPRK